MLKRPCHSLKDCTRLVFPAQEFIGEELRTALIKPVICIVDASLGMTGALMAARREAATLSAMAEFILVLPQRSRVPDGDVPEFRRVERLPLVQIRKSVASLIVYFPALLIATARLLILLRKSGCERLQVNDFYLMHGCLLRLLGFQGTIVSWIRIDPQRFKSGLGSLWLRLIRQSSDHVVAVSNFIQSRLPEGFNSELVYDALPESSVSTRERVESQRLVFVGNYIVGKGQNCAIAAFHRIAGQFPEASLEFYGGDMGLAKNQAYRHDLEEAARKGPGAPRIQFKPSVLTSTVAFEGALAALNFSRSESFSLTCQEASGFGLPVIATRCGGPEEIIEHGVTGSLVPVDDIEAMAAAMAGILSDPAKAAEMGRAGAALMRHRFPPHHFREKLSVLFQL